MTEKKESAFRLVEKAVALFENLRLGQDYAASFKAATSAVDALREEAVAQIFPPHLAPMSEAGLLDFQMAAELMGSNADMALVELHSQALAGKNEELAAIVRSPRGQRLIELAARSRATSMHSLETQAAAGERESRKAVKCFQRKIAEQLLNAGQFARYAEILAVVPGFEARLSAALELHEKHHCEKIKKAAGVLAGRRSGLAARFDRLLNPRYTFDVPGISKEDRFGPLHRYSSQEVSTFITRGRCDEIFDELTKQLLGVEAACGIEIAQVPA